MVNAPETFPLPSPDAGWSRDIFTVQDAQVWPAGEMKRIPTCGVAHADGTDCPEAAIYRGDTRIMAPVNGRDTPTARLEGRYMWGGQVFAHFGHFICETLPRFWATSKVEADGIVVIGKHHELTRFSNWQERFLKYLGVDLPIIFIKEPTVVETLLVPGQGFGLGEIARGTPEFREMLGNITRNIAPDGAERIYISRTKTGKKGAILNELSVERNLERQGYRIFHPQEHTLEQQLAQYQAATHVIGLDSSAFHLMGLVARPDQKIAILLRRNMMAYYNIQLQLEGMCGRRPDIINVLEGDWLPPGQRKPSRLSWGQVNHQRLADELAQRGYLADAATWELPSEKGLTAALEHFRKRMGNVEFLPVERPINEVIDAKYGITA